MPISPDEPTYSPEDSEDGEKNPQRELFKSIAKTQLDTLGYSSLVKKVADFLKGKGAIADLAKAMPHTFSNDNVDLNIMVNEMIHVPNSEEARKLLATAIFGEPAQRNADRTVTVTAFNLAEPSSTVTQSKFLMLRDKREDKRFVPNIKGTDTLIRRFISGTGFLDEEKTAEVVFRLKKGQRISLPHPQDNSQVLEIDSPADFGDGKSNTAYSYRVQTKLLPY